MKKRQGLAAFAAGVLLTGALLVPAMAHGHHHGGQSTTAYPICPVEDCLVASTHTHNGTTYCGHTVGDGHGHYADCGIAGCTVLEAHSHKGTCGGHHGRYC